MKIYDLSHIICNDMPIYPGTEKPEILNAMTIEKNGFAEKKLSFYSHVGTHIDAPGHMIEAGDTLDQFKADKFFGRACRIDVPQDSKKIELPLLKKNKELLEKTDFVLFNTGWNSHWNSEKYFKDFPTLSADAAEYLCSFPFKGIGFDTISADCCNSHNLPIHKIILSHKKIIIENLTNLSSVPQNSFHFSCLPLKIANADGCPVRAVAILFNNKDII
jgi:kynurenine formamidase